MKIAGAMYLDPLLSATDVIRPMWPWLRGYKSVPGICFDPKIGNSQAFAAVSSPLRPKWSLLDLTLTGLAATSLRTAHVRSPN
jgi:hypothetical protein